MVAAFSSVAPSNTPLAESGPGDSTQAAPPAALMMADFDSPSPSGNSSNNAGFWQPVLVDQQQQLLLESMHQQQLHLPLI